jgi:hypothetical protein
MDMKVSYFVIIILKLKSAVCQKYNWHSFENQVYRKLLVHHALSGAKKKFGGKVVFSRKTTTPSTYPKCVGIIWQEKKNEVINVLYWNNLNELQIQFLKKRIDPYGVATTETWSKPYRATTQVAHRLRFRHVTGLFHRLYLPCNFRILGSWNSHVTRTMYYMAVTPMLTIEKS